MLHDPALSNDGDDDSAATRDGALVAWDAKAAAALVSSDGLRDPSNGFLGTPSAEIGQSLRQRRAAATSCSPRGCRWTAVGHRELTLALGFGADAAKALATAHASLKRGFADASSAYDRGWHRWLRSLRDRPDSAARLGPAYWVSLLVLAASEDKTFRGAGSGVAEHALGLGAADHRRPVRRLPPRLVARPVRGRLRRCSPPATAPARGALSRFLFDRQQKPDGSFPQNSLVDGTQRWENLQLDEVAFPLVLAWQLRRFDAATYAQHVKPAANFIVANGPLTPQERWENQEGYSPGHDRGRDRGPRDGRRHRAPQRRRRRRRPAWLATADDWQSKVEAWTATSNGPYSPRPYYLRLTKDANPQAGTTYSIGDGGPSAADQRSVVDPSYLELVRLGVKRFDDPTILNTVKVVDRQLAVDTPNGRFWHRFSFDGYGEGRDGSPWDISDPDTFKTIGRVWPIFAGERGEYELLAGSLRQAPARRDGQRRPTRAG